MKKKIITILILIIFISSIILYAFYIPNNDVISNENNLNYENKINVLSDNYKQKLFIVNISLVNLPAGYLNVDYFLSICENNTNKYINSTGINKYGNAVSVEDCAILHSNGTRVYTRYGLMSDNIITLLNFYGFPVIFLIKDNGNIKKNVYGFNMYPGPIKIDKYRNYTLSLIILFQTCFENVKNPNNYTFFVNFKLTKLEITDKMHGYFHDFDFIDGENYYIKPKAQIINVK